MYNIKVDVKMDTWLGVLPYHAWIEVDVSPPDNEKYPKTIGLGVNDKSHKDIITHTEKHDRSWTRKATFQFTADTNLLTDKHWTETVNLVEEIMCVKKYWLFNNNCRAYVDVFMCLCFSITDTCKNCFNCRLTDLPSSLYAYNYDFNTQKYYFQYEYNGHNAKYYSINKTGIHVTEIEKNEYEKNKITILNNVSQIITPEMIEHMRKSYIER